MERITRINNVWMLYFEGRRGESEKTSKFDFLELGIVIYL